jgi:hypothetical protein
MKPPVSLAAQTVSPRIFPLFGQSRVGCPKQSNFQFGLPSEAPQGASQDNARRPEATRCRPMDFEPVAAVNAATQANQDCESRLGSQKAGDRLAVTDWNGDKPGKVTTLLR